MATGRSRALRLRRITRCSKFRSLWWLSSSPAMRSGERATLSRRNSGLPSLKVLHVGNRFLFGCHEYIVMLFDGCSVLEKLVLESTYSDACGGLEFDKSHGSGWQCIVGIDFGSYVTHCYRCFIYLGIGSLALLLLKRSAGPEAQKNHFST
ncbi:hypothetical protein HN51_013572 [Arachis hypogaea]|nr:uncharacterized protein LOC114927533 [Arachis hypogaea]QHO59312.1 Dynein light chain 2, cytoplasmic [Arachis hypogaea]